MLQEQNSKVNLDQSVDNIYNGGMKYLRTETDDHVIYTLINGFEVVADGANWRIKAYNGHWHPFGTVGKDFRSKDGAEMALKNELRKPGMIFDHPLVERKFIVRRIKPHAAYAHLWIGLMDDAATWLPKSDGRILMFPSFDHAEEYARRNLSKTSDDEYEVVELKVE